MSENLEKMETIENGEIDVIDDVDYTEVEGGSGKVIGLVVAGLTGAAALGAVAYKKIKAKKDGQPKKKRKKLMWVEVEDDIEENDVVDSESKEVEEEKETEE